MNNLIYKNVPEEKKYIIEEISNPKKSKSIIKVSYLNDDKKQILGENFIKRNNNKKFLLNINNKNYKFEKKYLKMFGTTIIRIIIIILDNIYKLDSMFKDCNSLINIHKMKLKKRNIKTISNLFYGCTSLENLSDDISNFDLSKVTNIEGIFYGCNNLAKIPDISKWNTENINNMSYLFYNCSKLVYLPDISNWNINQVKDLKYFFYNCCTLISLPDISKWNISKVEHLNCMFNKCKKLERLPDIDKWNTSNVSLMGGLFFECESLKVLCKKYSFYFFWM